MSFYLPDLVKINDQVSIRQVMAESIDLAPAAAFFDLSAGAMQEAIKKQSLIVCAVEKQWEKIGYVAFEQYNEVQGLIDRMGGGEEAAGVIWNRGLDIAVSLFLNKDHCGKGIGSAIIKQLQLRHAEFPWMTRVFSIVNNTNKASLALHRKWGMQEVTQIYVPSCWDQLCCKYKFGVSGTAYKLIAD